jgi:hypothetical protein
MSGFAKTVRKLPTEKLKAKLIGQKNYDKVHFAGPALIKYNDSMKPPAQVEAPVVPLPDEEEIKRNKRRSVAGRGGGRASTILTQEDRLGP